MPLRCSWLNALPPVDSSTTLPEPPLAPLKSRASWSVTLPVGVPGMEIAEEIVPENAANVPSPISIAATQTPTMVQWRRAANRPTR